MEKIKLLLYCNKNGKKLVDTSKYDFDFPNQKMSWQTLNGKIVAECDFEVDEIDTIALSEHIDNDYYDNRIDMISKKSCLTCEQMSKYLGDTWDSIGYAIKIKNLKERVMELSDCHKKYGGKNYSPTYYMPITNAPQNMMRVWIYENGKWVMYILISVRPEWLCLELNGEKTIEVRKKVLKEML